MESAVEQKVAPFDTIAEKYDQTFEGNLVTQRLRPIVWQSLLKHFRTGDRILELNSGTGTDAIFLAEHGIAVTATDASFKMLELAKQKVETKTVKNLVTLKQLSFDELDQLLNNVQSSYDGAFSNFGGLNCTLKLPTVLEKIAHILKPNGSFIVCLLNKLCIWKIASFALRGNFSKALRRFESKGIDAMLGNERIHVWYYTPRQVVRIALPWFYVEKIYGLSIVSPPPNSLNFVSRFPRLTQTLISVDDIIRNTFPFYALGDHFVVELRRKNSLV